MREFESIMLSRPRFLISLIFLTMMTAVDTNDEIFRKQIHSDFVKETDFDFYLDALEKTVEFCVRHKIYVDLNMDYGLFLIDVNLRDLVQQKRKTIPIKRRARLIKLLMKNNEVTKYFHEMAHKHEHNKAMEKEIKLSQLFYNRTTWPRASDKFNIDLLSQTKMYSTEKLEEMYGKFDKYAAFVYDAKKIKPTPGQFDECAANLGLNDVTNLRTQSPPACQIPSYCKELVEKGTDYGYGLLHRLLLLVVARFSRQCIMFSKTADKYKTDTYCMMAFNEAEYISSYNFRMPDLMFEHMTFCGLLGHAQFFRNFWLKSLLQYQTSEGCFSQNFVTGEFNEKLLREGEEDSWRIYSPVAIMNGQCQGHFTAVAAAALSHALRYILETYY